MTTPNPENPLQKILRVTEESSLESVLFYSSHVAVVGDLVLGLLHLSRTHPADLPQLLRNGAKGALTAVAAPCEGYLSIYGPDGQDEALLAARVLPDLVLQYLTGNPTATRLSDASSECWSHYSEHRSRLLSDPGFIATIRPMCQAWITDRFAQVDPTNPDIPESMQDAIAPYLQTPSVAGLSAPRH